MPAFQTSVRPAQSYARGVVLVALGMAVSSTIGLGVRAIDQATPWQILMYRSLGTIGFISIVLVIRNAAEFSASIRQLGPPAIVGGLGLMLASCGVIVAFHHTTVANAFFLVATAPFLAALMGAAFLLEKVRPEAWLAILFGLIGVAIMVGDGLSRGNIWGNIAGLIAAFGLALFAVALRWGRFTNLLVLALVGGCLTFAVATTATAVSGAGFSISVPDLVVSLAMGAFQLGCALLLITAGSPSVPAAEIALLGLVEIILAPIWVWLVFGESVGVLTLMGGATVLGAILFDTVSGMRTARKR
ncbi:DMT family transporter [Roseibium sp. SCP14]|uniref:DMT family transporter n=1 Tax=Roseibium sp. SCP14 TaxID=3141375 RepID=UPI0033390157